MVFRSAETGGNVRQIRQIFNHHKGMPHAQACSLQNSLAGSCASIFSTLRQRSNRRREAAVPKEEKKPKKTIVEVGRTATYFGWTPSETAVLNAWARYAVSYRSDPK